MDNLEFKLQCGCKIYFMGIPHDTKNILEIYKNTYQLSMIDSVCSKKHRRIKESELGEIYKLILPLFKLKERK